MNPAPAVEIAAAVASKIAPEASVAMRSLVGKMLGNNVGAEIAETVGRQLPGDMATAFRKEWLEQSVAMFGKDSKIAKTANQAVDDLPNFEFLERSPMLEQVSQTTSTGRGLGLYKDMLHLKDSDLSGKILDVGSGSWQQLAYDARRAGLPANITSVDPRFGLNITRDLADSGVNVTQRLIGRLYPEQGTISATADKLPFADNTFDKTLALFSTSRYRTGMKDIFADLSEMHRVTKPGGEVRIYPIWQEHVDRFRTVASALRMKTSFKADAPAIRPDFEAGRPAGVIDQMMTLHK
jgi:SAM-dependent methyltransferase